jgi:methionine-rich copper-binding protein CopC
MRRRVASGLCLLLVLVAAPLAAHSLLMEASPAANSTIDASPPALRLRFNNRIEKRLSRLRLVDERGAARDLPVAEDGAADWLTARVPVIAAGRYRVEWQVLSTDGHVVTGRFSFTVRDSTRVGGR